MGCAGFGVFWGVLGVSFLLGKGPEVSQPKFAEYLINSVFLVPLFCTQINRDKKWHLVTSSTYGGHYQTDRNHDYHKECLKDWCIRKRGVPSPYCQTELADDSTDKGGVRGENAC